MNPSLIRLDDESPFTSPTPVGLSLIHISTTVWQQLDNYVVFARLAQA